MDHRQNSLLILSEFKRIWSVLEVKFGDDPITCLTGF